MRGRRLLGKVDESIRGDGDIGTRGVDGSDVVAEVLETAKTHFLIEIRDGANNLQPC